MFSLGDKIELKHRSKLRYDPKVIDALSSIWSYMEKNEDGNVEKEEYLVIAFWLLFLVILNIATTNRYRRLFKK